MKYSPQWYEKNRLVSQGQIIIYFQDLGKQAAEL